MQKKIFSLLVLLMTAVSGAWAQDTYKIDAVYTLPGQSQDLSIDDAASLPFTKKLRELDPNISNWEEYNLVATNINVSGDNIVKGTDANWDTEITFNGAGTATVSYGIQSPEYGQLGSATITITVTKNEAPATTTNYYLVGTMNDWGASKQFLLTPNPGNAAEYMITLNLKADTQLKVIGVDAQNNATWYPSGDNYYVNTAGQYTVYFRPDGSGTGEGWHQGYIYLDPAPAPAVPLTDLGSGQWQFQMPSYAVVAKIEYDTELELQEENVNTAVLADWHGYEADITLQRTLKAGSWNTLAVPFNVSSQMLGYLTSTYGMQVKQLSATSLEGETIYLTFTDATEMVAGTPYLVKVSTDYDFSARALPNVEVSQELNPVETQYADFIPTLGKTLVTGPSGNESNTEAVLFVAANNTLVNPTVVNAPDQKSSYIKGFRAYFQLKNVPAEARSIALNLGDESTGIESLTTSPMAEGSTYDLQGRKVNANVNKGVYIMNGKKVIK